MSHTILLFEIFIGITVLSFTGQALLINCDLKPRGGLGYPREAGGRFRIAISNSPEKYVPGQTYNVILQGRSSVIEEPNMFNGFMLTVEPKVKTEELQTMGPLVAGIFRIIPNDGSTKIDELCPNTVVHTTLTFVPKIEVQWIAPTPGIGCVKFSAVVMDQHIWYAATGGLVLELCEMEVIDTMDVPERCSSCNEAKYEMNFEGLWTRQSHPQFYPDNAWLTRFSNVVGASHGFDYRFWKVNDTASIGLAEYSERENITILESEIKSNNTRTVIKAKGLSYPYVTGRTFAVFRVDPDHHLLSIISFIRPSPDWFVGLSGLTLCDNDGKWITNKSIDLYPYDLGIWGDLQYESRTKPTMDPITKIEESNDTTSPFFSKGNDKLKPYARVHLLKSREYEKHCSSTGIEKQTTGGGVSDDGNVGSPVRITTTTGETPLIHQETPPASPVISIEDCNKVEFIDYAECSVPQCDLDRVRIQYRRFTNGQLRDYCEQNNVQTEKLQPCARNCRGGKEPTSHSSLSKCKVSEWQEYFSACDPERCIRNRTRHTQDPEKKKDPECLKIHWIQEINCLSSEC